MLFIQKNHVACAILYPEKEARFALSNLSIVLLFTIDEIFFRNEPRSTCVMFKDVVTEDVSLRTVRPVVDLNPTSVVQAVRL